MFALSSLLVAAAIGVGPEEAPTTEQVRAAVQRSIPFIQEKGTWWIEEKKCASCHRVGTMLWSLTAARQNGLEVSDQLDEWVQWATDEALSKNDQDKIVGLGNKEGVAQLLLSVARADNKAEQNTVRNELLAILREDQQPNGSWNAGGQLPSQKRPKQETADVSTMWLTLALLEDAANKESASVVEKGMIHIDQSPPGKSTEWFAVRLLLAVRSADDERRDQMVNQLLKQQNADGGWGWLVGDKSDALGTGLALYALRMAGEDREASTIQRARQFLVNTQKEDGSWDVRGTKANKKEAVQETAVYWGTTWAALGLMASLPGPQ